MSIDSFINVEPPIMVLTQKDLGAISPGGMPVYAIQGARSIQGRINPQGENQKPAWISSLVVESDYIVYTLDGTLTQAMFLLTFDNRLFQIVSQGHVWYQKGNLPTYFKYALKQQIRGLVSSIQ